MRHLFIIAAAALLTACGAGAADPAAPSIIGAALPAQANAPVADCEADGCSRPRIVDGLAEQYRAAAEHFAAEPAAR